MKVRTTYLEMYVSQGSAVESVGCLKLYNALTLNFRDSEQGEPGKPPAGYICRRCQSTEVGAIRFSTSGDFIYNVLILAFY